MIASKVYRASQWIVNNSIYMSSTSLPHTKILQSKTWKQFMSVFMSSKSQLTPQAISSVSRHIISLIKGRELFTFQQAKEVCQTIQAGQLKNLSVQQIISLLQVLRALEQNNFSYSSLTNNLLQKLYAQLKPIKKIENLSQMIGSLLQMCYFNHWSSRLISEKILYFINENQKNIQTFKINQLGLIIYALSNKSYLSSRQKYFRRIILRKIVDKISSISLDQLIRIGSSLNKSEGIDFEIDDIGLVSKIIKKIQENVCNFTQRNIFQFLKSENKNGYPGFFRIYEQICNNVFQQINTNGKSDMDSQLLLKILNLISKRISYKTIIDDNKNKLRAFLNTRAQQIIKQNNNVAKYFLLNNIKELINNRFYDISDKTAYTNIIKSLKVDLQINLLQVLACHNFPLKDFTQSIIKKQEIQKLNSPYILLKYMHISFKLNKQLNNHESNEFHQLINNKLSAYSQPNKFSLFYNAIRNDESTQFYFIFQNFPQFVKLLKNPFQQSSTFDKKQTQYAAKYLSFILNGINFKEAKQFIKKHYDNITLDIVSQVLNLTIKNKTRDSSKFNHLINILILSYRYLQNGIKEAHRGFLLQTIQLIKNLSKNIVLNKFQFSEQRYISLILLNLFSNYNKILEIKQNNNFLVLLESILERNYRKYHFQIFYKNTIYQLLRNIQHFDQKIVSIILKHGLKFNLVQKHHLQKISKLQSSKISLSWSDKQKIKYIKQSTYKLQNFKISQGNLINLFHNHNYFKQIQQNLQQIFQIIQKSRTSTLGQLITNFNQPRNQSTKKVLGAIFNQLNTKEPRQLSNLDLVSIFQTLIKKNYRGYDQFLFSNKVIDSLKQNVKSFSLQSHAVFIRYFSYIYNHNNKTATQYYNKLHEYFSKDVKQYGTLLYHLTSTNHTFKQADINVLDPLIQFQPYYAIKLFFVLQNKCSSQFKSSFLQKIQTAFKQDQKVFERLNIVQYTHILQTYPQLLNNCPQFKNQSSWNLSSNRQGYIFNNVLTQIATLNQTNVQKVTILSQTLYHIKNHYYMSLSNRKPNAENQKKLFKKVFLKHMSDKGIEAKLTFVGKSEFNKFVEYIAQQSPQLLKKEQAGSILSKLTNKSEEQQVEQA